MASSSFEEHSQHFRLLFERLETSGVVIKSGEREVGVHALSFLDHYVDTSGIRPLPDKVKAVVEFPKPTSLTKLCQFLGLVNFYRRFVRNCAALLEPLDRLLCGTPQSATLASDSAADDEFLAIERAFSEATVLIHRNTDCALALMTDASSSAVRAVLQQQVDGEWQPLDFFSERMNAAQTLYSVFGRELLTM